MTHGLAFVRRCNPAFAALLALSLAVSALPEGALASPMGGPALALPASLPFADSAFENVWRRNDQPVASGALSRSWTWGPAPLAAGLEPYADAADGSGKRLVQYFDKSRMEINNPGASPTGTWFVTNGLLTVELISGRMQVGNLTFETRRPADIPLASDPGDAQAPTYASFGTVSNTSAGEQRQLDRTGGYATQRIAKSGAVTDDPSKSGLPQARITYYEKATGHNVPQVFWSFLNGAGSIRFGLSNSNQSLLDPWVFAMGYPISDAYWASVKIEGKQQEVLIQAFERRVLTYAPGLPQGWQVQMGNIGQHYFQWRYGLNGAGPQKQAAIAPGLPVRLTIPALGVSTRVEYVGVDKNNNMDIPTDPSNVAWFQPGTLPGTRGNAVMDGHLDWYGIPKAVFFYLDSLVPGDRLYVRDNRGIDRPFVVTRQLVCNYAQCPLMDIFGPTSAVRLNLITCAGVFNRAQQNYDRRLVIYSEAAQ